MRPENEVETKIATVDHPFMQIIKLNHLLLHLFPYSTYYFKVFIKLSPETYDGILIKTSSNGTTALRKEK